MTNCIFYALFFSLFLNFGFGSLRFSQINRTFLSIFKGMVEASVYTVDTSGESTVPYYNKNKLEGYVDDFLKHNIEKYTKNYTVDLKYLDSTQASDESRVVSINLKAKINVFFDYDKTLTFSVMSKENL